MRRWAAAGVLVLLAAPVVVDGRFRLGAGGAEKIEQEKKSRRALHSRPPRRERMAETPVPERDSEKDAESAANQTIGGAFRIAPDKIRYWRSLGHGYRDIVRALVVAEEAFVQPGVILQERVEGRSWTQIAAERRMSADDLDERSGAVIQPLRRALKRSAIEERARSGEGQWKKNPK